MHLRLITVAGEYTAVLPKMLKHYRALGVDEILVHCRGRDRDEIDRIVEAVLQQGGIVVSATEGGWGLSLNTVMMTITRQKYPDDWFLIADPDEFHLYPQNVKELLHECDRRGFEYVEGCLLDRISESGRITTYEESGTLDLWEQYNFGGFITGPLCGGVASKIVAAKGRIKLSDGQHTASGRGCPVSDAYVQVHHFKWMNDLIAKLGARSRKEGGNEGRYSGECIRFLQHYELNNRIEISRPDLLIAEISGSYIWWPEITRMRKLARIFKQTRGYPPHKRTLAS
jgi:hypothetical protein